MDISYIEIISIIYISFRIDILDKYHRMINYIYSILFIERDFYRGASIFPLSSNIN